MRCPPAMLRPASDRTRSVSLGRSEKTPQQHDDQLLDNLNNDKGRMSATKYVAGYMTYKVFQSSFLM